jgi:transposase
MAKVNTPACTAGIDVGDKRSQICVLDEDGEVVEETQIPTSKAAVKRVFARRERMRVTLEVGVHSPWLSDLLRDCGHDVIVANPRSVELLTKSDRKNDRNDAELLARIARADSTLLAPITHRTKPMREDLAVLRARDASVAARTKLVNAARGMVKSAGEKIPKCSPEAFASKALEYVPDELAPAIEPLLAAIASMTDTIKNFDRKIHEIAKRYPDTKVLEQVIGVGELTALAFILTLGDRTRFKKSRDVGPYLGLVPRQQKSCTVDPQLKITKAGNSFVRRLLVQSAQCVLRKSTKDSDLKRWGTSIAARGGKNAKKRAVVAVARKLAVLLHRLWTTRKAFEALHQTNKDDGTKEKKN